MQGPRLWVHAAAAACVFVWVGVWGMMGYLGGGDGTHERWEDLGVSPFKAHRRGQQPGGTTRTERRRFSPAEFTVHFFFRGSRLCAYGCVE